MILAPSTVPVVGFMAEDLRVLPITPTYEHPLNMATLPMILETLVRSETEHGGMEQWYRGTRITQKVQNKKM